MLTGDLVRARVKGRALHPSFVEPGRAGLRERAAVLVDTLRDAVAERWTRGEIDEALTVWIGDARDHKVLRGLAKLALDRAEFEVSAPRPPAELRQLVFTRAREMGPLDLERGPFERPTADDVLVRVADELGMAADALSDALYADLQDQQRITACDVPDGDWLVHRYNVALVQALLLKAVEVRVHLDGPSVPRTRQLFRHIKFRQLLYRAERDGDALRIVLDGPTSLFRQTTRYGLQLAWFFPALLLQTCPWKLEATVLWTKARHEKTLTVTSTQGLVSHLADTGAYATREQQWFAERWDALETDWRRSDDTAPLQLGPKTLVLPDFTFRNGDRTAHLDIVGYWRRDYLERRIAALREYGPGNLVLAVSRKLRGSKEALADFEGEVIEFAEIVPPRKVLEALERVGR